MNALVAQALGLEPASLRLVAAHPWTRSARSPAGVAAALVTRPGNVVFPLGPQADIVGPDLPAVAAQIVATDR